MKLLNYVFIALIGVLAMLFIQQCSKSKNIVKDLNETISLLESDKQLLLEYNQLNKEKYYELKSKYDSCRLSPAKEVIRTIYKYRVDTVYEKEASNFAQVLYKDTVETITNYFSDSLYKVTTGIVHRGDLINVGQMLELTRMPLLPVDNYLELPPLKVQPSPAKLNTRKPRLFITSGFEYVQLDQFKKLDYNAGLTLLDNHNRIFQLRKSLTCKYCASIDFGVPLIYSKNKTELKKLLKQLNIEFNDN